MTQCFRRNHHANSHLSSEFTGRCLQGAVLFHHRAVSATCFLVGSVLHACTMHVLFLLADRRYFGVGIDQRCSSWELQDLFPVNYQARSLEVEENWIVGQLVFEVASACLSILLLGQVFLLPTLLEKIPVLAKASPDRSIGNDWSVGGQ